MQGGSSAAAADRYLKGNKLSREKETEELVSGLSTLLLSHGVKPGDVLLQQTLQQRINDVHSLIDQGTTVTDGIQDALSKCHQDHLAKLVQSTHKLQDMFDQIDAMNEKLNDFGNHITTVRDRLKLVKSAKDKKFPRIMKVCVLSFE